MYLDDSKRIESSFDRVTEANEGHEVTDETRKKVSYVIVEGGAQGLLSTFLRTKLDLPNAELERLGPTRSRVSMIEKKRDELFELLKERLPHVFKVVKEAA